MTTPGPLGAIAHYNLLERLDPSGPGELYRARDTHHGRTVAVRLLPSAVTPDAASRATLIERARSLIAFSHPNVTIVFDAGEHDGRVYIAFEFLRGDVLRSEMGGRAMNVRRALDVAIQIADAVATAHAAGFLHGGLSPDSVTITPKGQTKVPGFELASRAGVDVVDGDVRLRDYEAPEEAGGSAGDERADIYSVGAILYEMLTGRRPQHKGASAPSASNAHVPKELDTLVLKAIAPMPPSRYQSAAALAADLRTIAASIDRRGGVGDEDEPPPTARRGSSAVVLVAVLVVALVGLLFWITRS
jgi:eukaryotic-like serine/threonine-protein kinase